MKLIRASAPSPAAQPAEPLALGLIRPDVILLPEARNAHDSAARAGRRPAGTDESHRRLLIAAMASVTLLQGIGFMCIAQVWSMAARPSRFAAAMSSAG